MYKNAKHRKLMQQVQAIAIRVMDEYCRIYYITVRHRYSRKKGKRLDVYLQSRPLDLPTLRRAFPVGPSLLADIADWLTHLRYEMEMMSVFVLAGGALYYRVEDSGMSSLMVPYRNIIEYPYPDPWRPHRLMMRARECKRIVRSTTLARATWKHS